MKIVKLHTTSSTNTFLKELVRQEVLENFTVVVSKNQTNGRGQRGNIWHSEDGKNLLLSILIKHQQLLASKQFELNIIISLAILKVIKTAIPNSSIKWPNDIMAGSKKIGGVLIENTLKGNIIKHSIVGVGLNVNQKSFPKNLPNASALIHHTQKEINLDVLLDELLNSIEKHVTLYRKIPLDKLTKEYLEHLYLLNQSAVFKDENRHEFIGKITGINPQGKLQVLVNNQIKEFGFKEIQFI